MNEATLREAFARAFERRGFSFSLEGAAARVEGAGAQASFAFAIETHTAGDDPVRDFFAAHASASLAVDVGALRGYLPEPNSTTFALRVGAELVPVRGVADVASAADAIALRMAKALASGRWGESRGVALERAPR